MNSLCTFQKRHITFNHISNKTLTSKINSIREAVPRKDCLLLENFQKEGGAGFNPNPKFLGRFFGLSFGHFPKKRGGVKLIPKVLGWFLGSFEDFLGWFEVVFGGMIFPKSALAKVTHRCPCRIF